MTLIEEAITNWFGERCPDHEQGCPACDAWAEYDDLQKQLAEDKALADRLYDGTDNFADRTAYRKARGM